MNRYLRLIFSSFVAGVIMALASFELVAVGARDLFVLGAFLQGFGLLLVTYLNLPLFNCKVNQVFTSEHKLQALLDLIIILIVNVATIVAVAYFIRLVSNNNLSFIASAESYTSSRIVANGSEAGKDWRMALGSGVVCGIICYLGGLIYKKSNHPIIKAFSIFFAVGLYVVCGFENIMTNTFYISFSQHWTTGTALDMLLVTLGNAVGVIASYFATNLIEKN